MQSLDFFIYKSNLLTHKIILFVIFSLEKLISEISFSKMIQQKIIKRKEIVIYNVLNKNIDSLYDVMLLNSNSQTNILSYKKRKPKTSNLGLISRNQKKTR